MRINFKQYLGLLITYLRPQWFKVFLMLVFLGGSIAFQLLNPQILGYFIDSTSKGAPLNTLITIACLFLGVALTSQIVAAASAYFSEDVGWNATNALREDLAKHCLSLDLSFHQQHTSGELIERLDGDISNLADFFSLFVIKILGSLFLLLGIVLFVFVSDWRMGFALSLYTFVALLVLNKVQGLGVPHFRASRQAKADLSSFFGEQLAATEDIRSLGAISYVKRDLAQLLRNLLEKQRKSAVMFVTIPIVSFVLLAIGTSLVFTLGAFLYYQGLMSLGTVFVIVRYTDLLNSNLQEITSQLDTLQRASATIQRISEIYYTPCQLKEIEVAQSQRLLDTASPSVAFDNVTFGYSPDNKVLKDLSFYLAPGKVLGLLGRTGSGKSTIAKLLFRFYDPLLGEIKLNGINIRSIPLVELRRHIGIVTQDVQLFDGSIRDNLTFYDNNIHDDQIVKVIKELGLNSWYERLPQGLDSIITPHQIGLSAGEAQLLALARVFLKEPQLVVLDEASARLDPATEQLIEQAIDKLLTGRTAIIIAHRLATLQRADNILVMENGQVCEQGSRTSLLADPNSRFYQINKNNLKEFLLETLPQSNANGSADNGEIKNVTVSNLASEEISKQEQINNLSRDKASYSTPVTPQQKISPLKAIFQLATYRPGLYLINIFFRVTVFLVMLATGLIMRNYFDALTQHQEMNSSILWSVIYLLGTAVAVSAFTFGNIWITQTTVQNIAALLRENITERLYELPGAKALPDAPGEVVSRLGTDVDDTSLFVSSVLLSFISRVVLLIVVVAILWSINPFVTIVTLLPLFGIWLIIDFATKRIQHYRRLNRSTSGEVSKFIGEMFNSVMAIQVAGRETSIIAHFRILNQARRKAALKGRLFDEVIGSMTENTANICIGLLLILVGVQISSGTFTVGAFALFTEYLFTITNSMSIFGVTLRSYKQTNVSLERLIALMQGTAADRLIQHRATNILKGELPKVEYQLKDEGNLLTLLDVKNLTYLYPSTQRGIQHIDLKLERGSFTVITGRIGSGKTTLLRSLLGLLPKETGEICWNNREVQDLAGFLVPPRSSYTPQVPHLFSKSLKENILLGLPEDQFPIDKAVHLAVLEQDICELEEGLETLIGTRGVKLSGGQLQRAAAARMFVRESELLVFDDLSSALDVETERQLWQRLSTQSEKTCLAVSHRRVAFEQADKIIVLKDGQIEAEGTLEELLNSSTEMQLLWQRFDEFKTSGAEANIQ